MNIFENLKLSRENPSNRISEQAAVEAAVHGVGTKYKGFLKSYERQRVIFAVDFVLGQIHEKIVLETPITYAEPEYELFRMDSQGIFLPNRINREDNRSNIFSDSIEKVPPPLTETLKEFRKNFPNTKLDCDITFEILQGSGNPKHALVIEKFFTDVKYKSDPIPKKLPTAEIWTVTKLESKMPIGSKNTNKSMIPYNTIPETRVRRVSGGQSGFRGR